MADTLTAADYGTVTRFRPASFVFGVAPKPGTDDIFNYPLAVRRYHKWMLGQNRGLEQAA